MKPLITMATLLSLSCTESSALVRLKCKVSKNKKPKQGASTSTGAKPDIQQCLMRIILHKYDETLFYIKIDIRKQNLLKMYNTQVSSILPWTRVVGNTDQKECIAYPHPPLFFLRSKLQTALMPP